MDIFNAHKSLTICARDFISYMEMKRCYPKCRIMLAPDMALYKDWHGYFSAIFRRKDALLCLKEDIESRLSDTDKKEIKRLGERFCGNIIYCNTDKTIKIECSERDNYLMNILEQFRGAKLVITDRLHGMIFAAITGTPCVVFGNQESKRC